MKAEEDMNERRLEEGRRKLEGAPGGVWTGWQTAPAETQHPKDLNCTLTPEVCL